MGKKVTKCISCGSNSFDTYCKGLVKCKDCGLIVAKEIPTPEEVQKLYQQDYFFGMEYFDYKADRPALERNFRKRMTRMRNMFNPDFNVAEIGCAYGYFLNMSKDHVKSHIGFDVSQEGIEFAQKELGVNATTQDFIDYKIKPNSLDSVFMWDVIEHLAYPDTYIKKVGEVLKPGGHVAITTGNIEAWLPKKRGGEWRMIHPPTHVYYFSPSTLDLLLKKHGLKTVSVKHASVSRNVGSVFNQIISNRKATKKSSGHIELAYKLFKMANAHKLNIPVNTFDIMEVVAVKA
jgi:2-polyprenyl-3-methyl-5-hydroxy-6-metoxy-1,4-benzoquinol methylase